MQRPLSTRARTPCGGLVGLVGKLMSSVGLVWLLEILTSASFSVPKRSLLEGLLTILEFSLLGTGHRKQIQGSDA